MNYLPTAFANLFFALKLYNHALDAKISREELDIDLTFQSEDGKTVFVLPRRIFDNDDDFILAFENNLTIAFGAAAITLDRSRDEAGHNLPDPIVTDEDQCIALIYQIRCAFAHDIAEPRWKIKQRYRRAYNFNGMTFDLSGLDGKVFDYDHIGGPDRLIAIKDFAAERLFQGGRVR